MDESRRHVRRTHVNLGQPDVIQREVDYIMARAAEMESRLVTLSQIVLFSTSTGDAWVLDPAVGLALRVAVEGQRLRVKIVETDTSYAVEWTASYRLEGDAFVVTDGAEERVIYGYPVAGPGGVRDAEPGPHAAAAGPGLADEATPPVGSDEWGLAAIDCSLRNRGHEAPTKRVR